MIPISMVSSKILYQLPQISLVDGKLNDHDDAIRKLQQEIKIIKMQRRNDNPSTEVAQDDAIGGDQLSELFDAIN